CNTGTTQCCESVHKPGDTYLQSLSPQLVAALTSVKVPVGVNCSPISVLGGGNHCTQQTVCCTDNHFNGLIAIGCTPIALGL
ncbi:hypothetical protein L208DRAFT_1252927, partial [Tricholoma matsutake]